MQTHINSDEMDLGVSVLSGLGGGHVDDLASSKNSRQVSHSAAAGGKSKDKPSIERVRALTHLAGSALDDDVTVLSESRALLFEQQLWKKIRQHPDCPLGSEGAPMFSQPASQPVLLSVCDVFRLVRIFATRWDQR